MTVSPQRATDGNPHRVVEGRVPREVCGPREMNDHIEPEAPSATLPPTLFQLPNLNAAAQKASSTQPQCELGEPCCTSVGQSENEAPKAGQAIPTFPMPRNAAPVTTGTATESPQDAASVPTSSSHESGTETSRIQSNQTPLASKSDTPASGNPAGRAWMETVGSHGIVVLLLLVVVAAALITGRNTQDHDTTLSEQTELLDFGAGTDVDLPLPRHGFDDATEFVSSVDTEHVPTPQGTELSIAASQLDVEAAESIELNAGNEAGDETLADVANAAVLDEPQSEAGTPQGPGAEWDMVQVNEFMLNGGVDARAASTRDTSNDTGSTLPSLEDLAGESDTTESMTRSSPHRVSNTPNPVIDWSRYVPEYKPAADSSPQNQTPSQ